MSGQGRTQPLQHNNRVPFFMEYRREDTSQLGADMWMARQNLPRPSQSNKTAPHMATVTGRTEWGREAGVTETVKTVKPIPGMEMPWK